MKRRTVLWGIVLAIVVIGLLWYVQARQYADRVSAEYVSTARAESDVRYTEAFSTFYPAQTVAFIETRYYELGLTATAEGE